MRFIIAALLCVMALNANADEHVQLYKSAGFEQQRQHFIDALGAAQQRYQSNLPDALFRTLVENSNRRFHPAHMDQRALNSLRRALHNPRPALLFFQSPLGRKIVLAEVSATEKSQLARYSQGLPATEASATRRLLVRHLANTLPAKEAGAEVSLALAGVAADSLSQMLPGLLGGGHAQQMLDTQRQRLIVQIDQNLDHTLLFVYRNLSDPELEEFVQFAQSGEGQQYYQAALNALRAGLAVGVSSSELEAL